MDWDKLKIFHAVAEAGNFTKATYILNLSQSAISRQIQSLEIELKTQLFERHARGLSLTENGFGKRTSFYDYRVTNRGGKGIIGIVASSRNGSVAASFPVNEGDEVILSTDKGKVIRCAVKEIRTAGRNTLGVRIIKLSGEEKVVSAIKIEDNFN